MKRALPAGTVVAFTAAFVALALSAGCASRGPGPEKQPQSRLESELIGFRGTQDNFVMDLRMLNARRDVQRAQLAERLEQFDVERKAARSRVLDLHMQKAASTTDAEWKQLSGNERAALGTLLTGSAAAGSGLFHTGRPVDELRERANLVIQDDLRREAVSRTFDALEKELKAQAAERAALEKDAFAALERRSSTRGDLDLVFARADGLNDKAREIFLRQREALRARINAEEWTALWAPPKVESVEAFKNYGEKQGN